MILVLLLLAILLFAVNRLSKNEGYDRIPGPRGILFLNNVTILLMNPVKIFYLLRKLSNEYKSLFKLKIGPKKFILAHDPEDVEIIISGTKNTSKGYYYRFIADWLKQGLLLSDGTKWQQRRKILTSAFHFNILQHYKIVLEKKSWKLAEKIELEVHKPYTNIRPLISEFTLHAICETAMGTKLDEIDANCKRYKEAIYELCQAIIYRAQRVWMYPNITYAFTKMGRKQKSLLNFLSSFRDSVIESRRQSKRFESLSENNIEVVDDNLFKEKKKLAMLDLLLKAEHEGLIDASGIGEEVDTFMFEGHDTVASGIQMIMMLLACHQASQERVVEELRSIFGSENRSVTMNDLAQMKYLECCIKEGLRLYPPVPFISRINDVPLKLKDYTVPVGTGCAILIYDLHRRSDQFPEPLQFRPERFLDETPTWHHFAYIPFSAGPRNCIGQKFAMIEMKLALSAVLQRFKLHAVTRPEDLVFCVDLVLRPTHPIYVKFEKRN